MGGIAELVQAFHRPLAWPIPNTIFIKSDNCTRHLICISCMRTSDGQCLVRCPLGISWSLYSDVITPPIGQITAFLRGMNSGTLNRSVRPKEMEDLYIECSKWSEVKDSDAVAIYSRLHADSFENVQFRHTRRTWSLASWHNVNSASIYWDSGFSTDRTLQDLPTWQSVWIPLGELRIGNSAYFLISTYLARVPSWVAV